MLGPGIRSAHRLIGPCARRVGLQAHALAGRTGPEPRGPALRGQRRERWAELEISLENDHTQAGCTVI